MKFKSPLENAFDFKLNIKEGKDVIDNYKKFLRTTAVVLSNLVMS